MKLRSALKLPKEHGAWAMFYVPFVLGFLVAGRFNLPALLLLVAATAAFISRESLLIWWRAQKRERQTQSSVEAGRLLMIYGVIVTLTGAPLISSYKLYWLIPLALIGAVLLLVNGWQAAEFEDRTVLSEVMAIGGLTMTASAAFYTAKGVWTQTAFWLWALSAAYFASSVFYVKLRVTWLHAKTVEAKRNARWQCAGYHSFLLCSLLALAVTRSLPLFVLIAFAPVMARALRSLLSPEPHLNLKRIGIAEIVYSVIFLVVTTLTFRSLQ
ncbi:MAG: YwiC-like family protein [Acidobacteriota bacterium]|nr:YwiC-like family protein [Acidobacteriota bacterium]